MTDDEFRKMLEDDGKSLVFDLYRHGANSLTMEMDYRDDVDKTIRSMMDVNMRLTFEWLIDVFEKEQDSHDICIRYGILMLVIANVKDGDDYIGHADRLVELGLESGDSGLEETACGLAEWTRSAKALELLERYHSSLDGRPWMKSYVGKVVSELKEELKVEKCC